MSGLVDVSLRQLGEASSTTPSRPTLSMDLPLSVCKWDWCRLTFPSQDELVQHVLRDHVADLAPVKRKDLPILRRAEDGIGGDESVIPSIHVVNSQDQTQSQAFSYHDTLSSTTESGTEHTPDDTSKFTLEDLLHPSTPTTRPDRFSFLAYNSSPNPTPDPSPIAPSPGASEIVARILRERERQANAANGLPTSQPVRRPVEDVMDVGARRDTMQPRQLFPTSSASHSSPKLGAKETQAAYSSRSLSPVAAIEATKPTVDTPPPLQMASTISELVSRQQPLPQTPRRIFRSGMLHISPDVSASISSQSQSQTTNSSVSFGSRVSLQAQSPTQNHNPRLTMDFNVFNTSNTTQSPGRESTNGGLATSILRSQLEPVGQSQASQPIEESQWPIQTQAPYFYPSSLDSQSQ